jgi:very-short-patch-repair endonuclease
VDFAYPDIRLAIEVDGYRWHAGRARWEHDLGRRNALTARGWSVIHVTSSDIERHPGKTVRVIAEALARR